ncbi:sensor histidine kinase/response regulator [Tannerella sp. CAG:118]|nr:sensor histidine kinase/response regulator [Tannerella sp. CAG:118]
MIEHRLSPYFTVVPAGNGREALSVLESREADLILSDWMMPLMDGVELCREVKGSERWSHIPFVLMTVRSGAENRLEGCTSGAEAYVEKPLDFKLLVGTLNNLLALREGFRRHYAENYFIDMGERVKNKAGNDFMERLTGILRREIASRDVNIEDIAREMMMSRRKLFSLVKANTGKSVVEFIRSYKMRYAARLMVEENLAIKEIPQLVGIESASYFTKAFKAEFGDTPSAFLAKMRGRG